MTLIPWETPCRARCPRCIWDTAKYLCHTSRSVTGAFKSKDTQLNVIFVLWFLLSVPQTNTCQSIEIEGYHSSKSQGCKMGFVRNLGPPCQGFCAFPIFFCCFFCCCNHVVFPGVSKVVPLEVCKWTPCWAVCRWCSPPVQTASSPAPRSQPQFWHLHSKESWFYCGEQEGNF